mmetsp:Transcript_3196/g.10520  ORF Transcript_3196/g.10520 Transcript_3196/m.10520 type:complete len:202 (+) Transcript_3196:69-674(+)
MVPGMTMVLPPPPSAVAVAPLPLASFGSASGQRLVGGSSDDAGAGVSGPRGRTDRSHAWGKGKPSLPVGTFGGSGSRRLGPMRTILRGAAAVATTSLAWCDALSRAALLGSRATPSLATLYTATSPPGYTNAAAISLSTPLFPSCPSFTTTLPVNPSSSSLTFPTTNSLVRTSCATAPTYSSTTENVVFVFLIFECAFERE